MTAGDGAAPAPLAIVGGRLALDDGTVIEGDLLVRDGLIEAVATGGLSRIPDGAEVVDAAGRLVSPGLVDLHTHGGVGESFGVGGADAARRIAAFDASVAVTSLQASLPSLRPDDLTEQLAALAPVVGAPGTAEATVLGIHLEGPYLSPEQRGAHDPGSIRAPDADEATRIARAPGVSMVTLAPELDGALEVVRALALNGIVPAAGHSAAGPVSLDAAIAAGLRHITHLWSGQSALVRSGPWRVPGLLEASLASTSVTAEVIADGRHLPPTLLEIARRCLGDRLVVVSDATAGAGMPDGYRYRLGDVNCRVADGVGMVEGEDAFAGSVTTLAGMLPYLVNDVGWPVGEVLRMMTRTPASVLGLDDRIGVLRPGAQADVVVWGEVLTADEVLLRGRRLAPSSTGRGATPIE